MRVLGTVDAEASKFDREKWRTQLNPVLELWKTLTSSSSDIINRKVRRESTVGPGSAGAAGVASGKKLLDPIDDFVGMEYDLAGEICAEVNASLSALAKVRSSAMGL